MEIRLVILLVCSVVFSVVVKVFKIEIKLNRFILWDEYSFCQ